LILARYRASFWNHDSKKNVSFGIFTFASLKEALQFNRFPGVGARLKFSQNALSSHTLNFTSPGLSIIKW
jgi:hypothetical protein